MLGLTSEDRDILAGLARECSREGEEDETTRILIEGFERYSEEALDVLVKKRIIYPTYEEFFRDKYGSLLENIGFAGQTFEEAFPSKNEREWLCQLVRSCTGVPASDVEDIVQEISGKFWKAKWVERYNPLISSWRNFLLVPIQRYVNTYKLKRSKKVTTGAVQLDRDDERDSYGNTAASCLYDLSEDEILGNDLIRREVMEAWEDYLRSQKPIKTAVRRDFDKLCTLIAPGVPDIPVSDGYELDIFFLQGGYYNSRVTTYELYEHGITLMIPNYLLVDYITTDIEGNVHYQLYDEVTGDFITQKDFSNPNYNPYVAVREQRTWADLYDLLMQGLQVEEIARELRMAPPSVPARIQRLESLFRNFWLVSNKIPSESKISAMETYKCPNCRPLYIVKHEECPVCGRDMRDEVAKIRFNGYPWPKAYVSRETFERLGNRRQALLVKRCSLAIRF